MSKRYLVLGLSVFLALSLTVPALGGPSNPVAEISASAKKIAKKARKKAKKANQNAKAAQQSADQAQNTANGAQGTANDAQGAAANAQSTADAAQSAANNAQSTADGAQAAANAAQATADSKLEDTTQVFGTASANNSNAAKLASASCPSGAEVTGGGYTIGGSDPDEAAAQLEFAYGSGWIVQAQRIEGTTANNWSLQASVMCATR